MVSVAVIPTPASLTPLAAQMPLQNKKKFAQVIIDNNGSLKETLQQLQLQLKRLADG